MRENEKCQGPCLDEWKTLTRTFLRYTMQHGNRRVSRPGLKWVSPFLAGTCDQALNFKNNDLNEYFEMESLKPWKTLWKAFPFNCSDCSGIRLNAAANDFLLQRNDFRKLSCFYQQ